MSAAVEDTPVQDAPAETVAEETTATTAAAATATDATEEALKTTEDAITSDAAAADAAAAATAATTTTAEGGDDAKEAQTPSDNKKQLETLLSKATKQYALKNYAEAAELYAEAAEIQGKMNGENNPLNADVLYLYGRALFQCGVQKSDVLGGGVVDEAGAAGKEKQKGKGKEKDDGGVGSSKAAVAAGGDSSLEPKMKKDFHFSGDENFTEEGDEEDEGDEEGGEGEGEEGEEEQDDFTLAWEILDLARIQFNKRLETPPEDKDELRKIKESLSDVYDLLGEVSLESESFKQAVEDLSESLRLKEEIYQPESTLISEAHYKLSLALEFASQGGGEGEAEAEVSEEDQKKGREKSADHMRAAIDSCKKRIALEEKALVDTEGDTVNGKPRDRAEKSLTEAKELVKELEQRLRDLTMDPQQVDMGDQEILGGLLGSLIGKNPAEAKKQLEQAISGAKDLSGMVRKKDKAPEASSSASATNGGAAGSKRKAEDEPEAEEKPDTEMTSAAEPTSKKARVTTEEEEQASTA